MEEDCSFTRNLNLERRSRGIAAAPMLSLSRWDFLRMRRAERWPGPSPPGPLSRPLPPPSPGEGERDCLILPCSPSPGEGGREGAGEGAGG